METLDIIITHNEDFRTSDESINHNFDPVHPERITQPEVETGAGGGQFTLFL